MNSRRATNPCRFSRPVLSTTQPSHLKLTNKLVKQCLLENEANIKVSLIRCKALFHDLSLFAKKTTKCATKKAQWVNVRHCQLLIRQIFNATRRFFTTNLSLVFLNARKQKPLTFQLEIFLIWQAEWDEYRHWFYSVKLPLE